MLNSYGGKTDNVFGFFTTCCKAGVQIIVSVDQAAGSRPRSTLLLDHPGPRTIMLADNAALAPFFRA